MSNRAKYRVLYSVALAFCILPASAVILLEFPLWAEKGNAALASGITVSGITVFLLGIAATPLHRVIMRRLKTPSMWMIWGTVSLILYLSKKVIDSLFLISFAGFLGNLIGSVFFLAAEKYKRITVKGE